MSTFHEQVAQTIRTLRSDLYALSSANDADNLEERLEEVESEIEALEAEADEIRDKIRAKNRFEAKYGRSLEEEDGDDADAEAAQKMEEERRLMRYLKAEAPELYQSLMKEVLHV